MGARSPNHQNAATPSAATLKYVLTILTSLSVAALGVAAFWWFGERAPILTLPGTAELQEVRLGSKVGGRVKAVHVAESQVVSPGQPLVTFDLLELEAKRDQATAQLQAAEAALARAIAGPRSQEKTVAHEAARAAEARLKRIL